MSHRFRVCTLDQPLLLPPSLQDWLPEGHLARFVADVAEQLDLSPIYATYTRKDGRGQEGYHPLLLTRLMLYGYCQGVTSSRKIERKTHEDVAFRFLAADQHPDHDTIASFRQRHLEALAGLFTQALQMCQMAGLVKLGHIAIDGTKLKANASKHKAMSWGYANKLEEQLRQEVQELLRRAEQADAEEEPEIDIPDELARREDRLAAIKKAKEEIERRAQERFEGERAEYEEKLKQRKDKEAETGKKARGREPKPPQAGPRAKDQVNFTDEESRIMPSSDGFVQAYNAQAAVDIDTHLIVENHITQQPNDKQEIEPTLRQLNEVEGSLGKPDGLLADTGYFSENNVKRCEANAITPYISDRRERHNLPWDERFKAPPPCPEGANAVTAMAHRLRTPEGKAIYARRKSTVETVFGIIKEVLGFRQFHLRGLDSAQGEWNLVCMAWNLKRMYTLAS
jgi:transposase